MAYTTPYTFTALELLTAAKMNAIQNNISAIWTGTTAGDISYYTSSTARTRLGIGASGSLMRSTGSAPAWLGAGSNYQFLQVASGAPAWSSLSMCSVYHSTTQSVSNAVATEIAFDSEISDVPGWHSTSTNNSRITVDANGYYQASGFVEYTGAGGTGTYMDTVMIYINGVDSYSTRQWVEINAFNKRYSITTPIFGLAANDYIELVLEQNSGGSRTVQNSARFSVWRVR